MSGPGWLRCQTQEMFRVTIDALPPEAGLCDAFVTWFRESETPRPGSRLLNVGAGSGFGPCGPMVAELFTEVVGVDPNPRVASNPALSDYWVGTVEDFAKTYGGPPFDSACSIYVVEHVKEPTAFLLAVKETLRPGGYFYCITPNLYHYFALGARLSAVVGVEDALLHWLLGRRFVEQYHHAVHYRLNSLRRIRRSAEAAGYTSLDVLYLDNPEILQPYFSKIFRGFPGAYSRWVHKNALYSLFATMLYRLRS
jgi:2-polyprenyl-3-methyl-5-hydroxy-6-metoxy-1,4-benzoquinol methylase